MTNKIYIGSYSQTVFNIALERKELHECQFDLRKIASLVKDDALFTLLQDPELHFDNKARVLSERLGDINPLVLKLVSLLVTRGRLDMMGDIADEYQRLVDNYRGIEGAEVAEVITAIPLDDEDRLSLAQRLTNIVGKPIVLKPEVDPSIIGGIIIRIGDKLLDGSTRSKLLELKKELVSTGR